MCSLARQLFDALDLLCSDGLTSKGLDELVLSRGCFNWEGEKPLA
jgi:hypothetical protein